MKTKLKYNNKVKTDRDYGIPERWYDFHYKGHDIRISNWLGFEVLDGLNRKYISNGKTIFSFTGDNFGDSERIHLSLTSAILAMKHNDERLINSGIHTFRRNSDEDDYSLDNICTLYEHRRYFDSLEGEEWKQVNDSTYEVSNYFRVRKLRGNGYKVIIGRYVQPKFTKHHDTITRMSDAQMDMKAHLTFNVFVEVMRLFRGIEVCKHASFNFKEPSHNNEGFYHVNDLYLFESKEFGPKPEELVYDEFDGFHDIPQNENYQFTKDGKLWRKPRKVSGKNNSVKTLTGRYMKIGKDGYVFRENGVGVYRSIPTLLYTTFVGEIPEGMYVTYKDGDFCNRRIDNLVLTDKRVRHEYRKRKNK